MNTMFDKNNKIILLTRAEIINSWPFSDDFAYEILYHFKSNASCFEEFLIENGEKDEQVGFEENFDQGNQDLVNASNAFYGIKGFFKKNNSLYYKLVEKKVFLNLNHFTLECLIASCMNYVLIDMLKNKTKPITYIFFERVFALLTQPKIHYIVLDILKKHNVFEEKTELLIEGAIKRFSYARIWNTDEEVYKTIYINFLNYLRSPEEQSITLVNSCFETKDFSLIISYLKNYKKEF